MTGVGGRDHIWIDGVRLSPHDCPDCLTGEEYDCGHCLYFIPSDCRLRRDPFLLQDVRVLLEIYRERRTLPFRRRWALVRAIRSELETHGHPLHYSILARIVADRHRELGVSEKSVLLIMASHPEIFERVSVGIYKCKAAEKH